MKKVTSDAKQNKPRRGCCRKIKSDRQNAFEIPRFPGVQRRILIWATPLTTQTPTPPCKILQASDCAPCTLQKALEKPSALQKDRFQLMALTIAHCTMRTEQNNAGITSSYSPRKDRRPPMPGSGVKSLSVISFF